jgi:multidrug efflux pump
VQAAINASRSDLPSTLRSNPTYRKANPSAAPVIILALTSPSRSPGQIYDAVSNIVQQKIAQVPGVGDVELGGGSQPAVRVELIPFALNRYGIAMEDVRAALQAGTANRPKGDVDVQRPAAADLHRHRHGQQRQVGLRLPRHGGGLARTARRCGWPTWPRSATASRTSTPWACSTASRGDRAGDAAAGANVIETVDGVRDLLPELQASLPKDIALQVASDRTYSIRASLHEVEVTLAIAILLVVLVVSVFLRSARATFIPAVATIVSLLGTFGVMYLLGFSLNNLSLMALTVATGFVVDDAIVVLENTSRHIEAGMDRFRRRCAARARSASPCCRSACR